MVTLAWLTLVCCQSAGAFDNDFAISDIDFNDESFLDINAFGFRKSLDLKWHRGDSGWRIGIGSTTSDRAFMITDLRLRQDLSDQVSLNLDLRQDEFYAPIPSQQPVATLNIYPSSSLDIGFSVLASADHDKRQIDYGYAVSLGRSPGNYVRLSWLKLDRYWNEKNEFDDGYYERFGKTTMLSGFHELNPNWQIHYELEKDRPLRFVLDDQTSRFDYRSHDYQASFYYLPSAALFYGIRLRSMQVDKSLAQSLSMQNQLIDYQSADLFRVETIGQGYELTVGLRFDDFGESLVDALDASASYDFEFTTQQVYASLYHLYKSHQAWDLGLYVGDAERTRQYRIAGPDELDKTGTQSKLRLSWQYHSADQSSALVFSTSLNLDDLADDPGDGYGIYFQKTF